MNTLSEIEEYYKAREQQLLKKLHRQEAALAAAEQTLKRLTENQKAPMDETTEQRTAQEQAFKEKLYRDPLTEFTTAAITKKLSVNPSARQGSR